MSHGEILKMPPSEVPQHRNLQPQVPNGAGVRSPAASSSSLPPHSPVSSNSSSTSVNEYKVARYWDQWRRINGDGLLATSFKHNKDYGDIFPQSMIFVDRPSNFRWRQHVETHINNSVLSPECDQRQAWLLQGECGGEVPVLLQQHLAMRNRRKQECIRRRLGERRQASVVTMWENEWWPSKHWHSGHWTKQKCWKNSLEKNTPQKKVRSRNDGSLRYDNCMYEILW